MIAGTMRASAALYGLLRGDLARRPSAGCVSLLGKLLMKCWRGMPRLVARRGPWISRSMLADVVDLRCARCRTAARPCCAVKRIAISSSEICLLQLEVRRRPCEPSFSSALQHLARTGVRMRVEAAPAPRPSSCSSVLGRCAASAAVLVLVVFLVLVDALVLGGVAARRRRRPGVRVDEAVDDLVDAASRPSRSCRRASRISAIVVGQARDRQDHVLAGLPRCAWRSRFRLRASAARPCPSRACTCAPGRWCGRIRSRRVDSAASAASSTSSSAAAVGAAVRHQQRFGVRCLVVDRDAHVVDHAR